MRRIATTRQQNLPEIGANLAVRTRRSRVVLQRAPMRAIRAACQSVVASPDWTRDGPENDLLERGLDDFDRAADMLRLADQGPEQLERILRAATEPIERVLKGFEMRFVGAGLLGG